MILRRYHKTRVVEEEQPVKEQLPAIDDLVKREIKTLLDDGGVDYDERATKKELYDLLSRGH